MRPSELAKIAYKTAKAKMTDDTQAIQPKLKAGTLLKLLSAYGQVAPDVDEALEVIADTQGLEVTQLDTEELSKASQQITDNAARQLGDAAKKVNTAMGKAARDIGHIAAENLKDFEDRVVPIAGAMSEPASKPTRKRFKQIKTNGGRVIRVPADLPGEPYTKVPEAPIPGSERRPKKFTAAPIDGDEVRSISQDLLSSASDLANGNDYTGVVTHDGNGIAHIAHIATKGSFIGTDGKTYKMNGDGSVYDEKGNPVDPSTINAIVTKDKHNDFAVTGEPTELWANPNSFKEEPKPKKKAPRLQNMNLSLRKVMAEFDEFLPEAIAKGMKRVNVGVISEPETPGFEKVRLHLFGFVYSDSYGWVLDKIVMDVNSHDVDPDIRRISEDDDYDINYDVMINERREPRKPDVPTSDETDITKDFDFDLRAES